VTVGIVPSRYLLLSYLGGICHKLSSVASLLGVLAHIWRYE
jgi:hypothetical protein